MGRCPCFGSWKWRTRLRDYHGEEDDDEEEVCGPSAEEDHVGLPSDSPRCSEIYVSDCSGMPEASIGGVEPETVSPGPECEDPTEKKKKKKNVHEKARIFDYRELATATRDFREESVLGRGGFGTVYKGRLRDRGQEVAVKQLNKAGHQGEKEFSVEVLMLSLLRHQNLVNLLGYCAEGDQRLLVYEYMPFGSLEDHLHDLVPNTGPLDWNTRMKIAAGAARGLNYLHNEAESTVIYRDLKSSNILLDKGFHPKLSDFGLAKFGPVGDRTHVSTRVMGTQGYCAPEYGLSGKLTMKTDVYSFGVVLLELITGRRAVELVDGHNEYLVEWVRPRITDQHKLTQLADPNLHGHFSENILRRAANVASMCIREDPGTRPSINEVMLALDYLALKKFEDGSTRGSAGDDPRRSPKETTAAAKEFEREQAVAEAKRWGETWREKRRQIGDNISNSLER